MDNKPYEILRLEDGDFYTTFTAKYLKRKKYERPKQIVKAAIPGTIMSILVNEGQRVKRGDALCVMDSMKMNNTICSGFDGIVSTVFVSQGASIGKDAPMFEIE